VIDQSGWRYVYANQHYASLRTGLTLPQLWECQPDLMKAHSTGSMLFSIGRKDQKTTKEAQQGRGGQR